LVFVCKIKEVFKEGFLLIVIRKVFSHSS
jgi:hypothetical protein